MATQKKAQPAKRTTKAVTNAAAETVDIDHVKDGNIMKPRQIKFDDSVLVNVQSNVFGELIYENTRTGDKVIWKEFGDIQPMTIGDLRSMRSTQRSFFENNWVYIHDVVDMDYEDAKPEDVYKYLMISQYYKDVIDPDHFNDIFRMDEDEIRRRVGLMSDGAKMNLVVAANEAIARGRLDSLRKIKTLEEMLGCELASMQ